MVVPHSLLSEYDLYLFRQGNHLKIFEKLGAHLCRREEESGTQFAVWAPNAKSVAVIGDFNHWNPKLHHLYPRLDSSGVFEGFIPGIEVGELYKYAIVSHQGEYLEKGDPYARFWEVPPRTASVVYADAYTWKDGDWMQNRHKHNSLNAPVSVYELHFSSWKRKADGSPLSYAEMAESLLPYVLEMGFTHVEFMPLMEHPYDGSWGYQICGYFAPTSRYGSPEDFKAMVDAFHRAGIGVILDWVPSHYPNDAHGLYRFDGSHLYEHADPRQGYHPDWSSYIFNYGRHEVRNFLLSNAHFWFEYFHIDGIRVDAVASMLYLDYSRKEDEWIPNAYGGRENLEAIHFLQTLNTTLYQAFPDIITIAEESTSWPMITRPVHTGGLGFGMKWMMGWMNDTLSYFKRDTLFRPHHHHNITFSLTYAFTENFMLPLSHDEVAHGKGSLLGRMPGDEWRRFANLRLLFGYMFTHPGSKLLFMGGEFGQSNEWNHKEQLNWWMLDYDFHKGVQTLVKDLNKLYKNHKALFAASYEGSGFEWIDYGDSQRSVLSYLRKDPEGGEQMLVVCNMLPESHPWFKLGVPEGQYRLVLNTNLKVYGGTDLQMPEQAFVSLPNESHHRPYSIEFELPALAVLVFEHLPMPKPKPSRSKSTKK